MPKLPPRPYRWAYFLAKYEEYQALIAKKPDLNCQKRKWAKKRLLGAKPPKRPRGAPPGNRNALKHGFETREQHVVWAMMHAFLHATDAQAAKRRPRSATRERL